MEACEEKSSHLIVYSPDARSFDEKTWHLFMRFDITFLPLFHLLEKEKFPHYSRSQLKHTPLHFDH